MKAQTFIRKREITQSPRREVRKAWNKKMEKQKASVKAKKTISKFNLVLDWDL